MKISLLIILENLLKNFILNNMVEFLNYAQLVIGPAGSGKVNLS